MKIKVIQKDINSGVPEDSSSCAIARALKRQGARYVRVDSIEIIAFGASWATSKRLEKFIEDFDDGKKVKPTIFAVRLRK